GPRPVMAAGARARSVRRAHPGVRRATRARAVPLGAFFGAHALGQLHAGRRDPPELAARALPDRDRRLRDCARARAPARTQPRAAVLVDGRRTLPRLRARSRLAARVSRRHAGRLGQGARMRILHTMLRTGDMQRSIDFYTRLMGMKVLRTTDRPEQKYSLAFVGYGDEASGAVIEL